MSNYRRNYLPGGTYFFTLVTANRIPLFNRDDARRTLGDAIRSVCKRWPFTCDAIVVLPDHLHAIWTLPQNDADYSTRWSLIKSTFTRKLLTANSDSSISKPSRASRRERSVWQHRFWEHTCRDGEDLERCIDYLHFNPVKHGLAECVRDYPWSSFARHVSMGRYDMDWGTAANVVWSPPAGWE